MTKLTTTTILVLFSLFLFCATTEFGKAKSGKTDKIAAVHEYYKALNNNDKEAFLSLTSEDFQIDIAGIKGDREVEWKVCEGFHKAFNPLYPTLKNCALFGDSVSCEGVFHGKHVGEFNGNKPTNKYIVAKFAVKYDFNKDGLIENAVLYYDALELEEQAKGKVSRKEQILQDWTLMWNKKLKPNSFAQSVDQDKFEYSVPMSSNLDWDGTLSYMDKVHKSGQVKFKFGAPEASSTDPNVWLMRFSFNAKLGPNPFGAKPGSVIEQEGVAVFRFNEQDQLISVNSYFDPIDFLKQGGALP